MPRFPRPSPRQALWLAAIGLVAAAVGFRLASGRLPVLTEERLATASDSWRAAGVRDYDLTLTIEGSELDPGSYRVEVRGGVVRLVERDGQAVTGDLTAYGIDGLLALLRQELTLAADPQRGFGAPPGYRAYAMAELGADGLPWRYRRIVGGTSRWSEWRIESFEVRRRTPGASTPPPR